MNKEIAREIEKTLDTIGETKDEDKQYQQLKEFASYMRGYVRSILEYKEDKK